MPAVGGVARWRDPAAEPPPRGVKLLIYTSGGVTVIGDWSESSNYRAWSPMPSKPARPAGEPQLLTEDPDHGE